MKTLKEIMDDANKYDAARKECEKLREALAWALENGALYQGDYIVDGGCGCCSIELRPPKHLAQYFQRAGG